MPRSGLQVVTVRHVRIWIGHHYRYCMSIWPASTTNQSGPVTLTFDLLTLKVVSESRVTWATCVPIILVFSSYSRCTRQTSDRQTDRQTDRRQTEGSIIA